MYDLFELWTVPDRLTDQLVPFGSPDSVKLIGYLKSGGSKAIASVTLAPFTVMVPEEGDDMWPDILPTVNPYDPLGSLKTTEDVEDDLSVPLIETFQVAPNGRPDSMKVTSYVIPALTENVMPIDRDEPLTATVPEEGDAK